MLYCNKIIHVTHTERHLLNVPLICRKADDPLVIHFYTNNHTVEHSPIIVSKWILQEKIEKFAEKETECFQAVWKQY